MRIVVRENGKKVVKYQCPYCCEFFTEEELRNHNCKEKRDFPLMFP